MSERRAALEHVLGALRRLEGASSFSWQWSVMLCMFRMMASGCVNTARLTFCTTTWVSVNVLRNTARNVSLMLPLPNGTIVTRRPLTLNLLTSNASSMAFPSGGV